MKKITQEELKKKKDIKQGCFTMVIIAIIMIFVFKSCSSKKMEDVTIKMPPAQIILVNNSSEEYKKGTVIINDKYKARFDILPANGTFTIGLLHFSDDEGNRYGLMMVTKKVYVTAENSKGDTASCIFETNL